MSAAMPSWFRPDRRRPSAHRSARRPRAPRRKLLVERVENRLMLSGDFQGGMVDFLDLDGSRWCMVSGMSAEEFHVAGADSIHWECVVLSGNSAGELSIHSSDAAIARYDDALPDRDASFDTVRPAGDRLFRSIGETNLLAARSPRDTIDVSQVARLSIEPQVGALAARAEEALAKTGDQPGLRPSDTSSRMDVDAARGRGQAFDLAEATGRPAGAHDEPASYEVIAAAVPPSRAWAAGAEWTLGQAPWSEPPAAQIADAAAQRPAAARAHAEATRLDIAMAHGGFNAPVLPAEGSRPSGAAATADLPQMAILRAELVAGPTPTEEAGRDAVFAQLAEIATEAPVRAARLDEGRGADLACVVAVVLASPKANQVSATVSRARRAWRREHERTSGV